MSAEGFQSYYRLAAEAWRLGATAAAEGRCDYAASRLAELAAANEKMRPHAYNAATTNLYQQMDMNRRNLEALVLDCRRAATQPTATAPAYVEPGVDAAVHQGHQPGGGAGAGGLIDIRPILLVGGAIGLGWWLLRRKG